MGKIDQETLSQLDFFSALELLEAFVQTPPGREEVRNTRPSSNAQEIQRRLSILEEALKASSQESLPGLGGLEDPKVFLSPIHRKDPMQGQELLSLLAYLQCAERVDQALDAERTPLLKGLFLELKLPLPLTEDLARSLAEDGSLRDEAHPELADVRKKQSRARKKVTQHLEGVLQGKWARFLINEPYVTQRGERFVVPVRVEHQTRVKGLVHATSASGATVFMEPMSAVELNNDLIFLRRREQEISNQVFRELSQKARENLETILSLVETLGRLDAVFASVVFAHRFEACTPEINSVSEFRMQEARHPLLEADLGRNKVVPLSISMNPDTRCLVISGPNTGGKTVALKTTGLLYLFFACGLPVPARSASFPVLEGLLADIGDHQSLAQHLSTFSAHVQRVQSLLAHSSSPKMVLLDELGRGTDPAYGSILAVAILEEFLSQEALIMSTTHHLAVKSWAAKTKGVLNASVGLDSETLKPTYRLEMGTEGISSGLEIAAQLGLKAGVVQRAREKLDDRHLELEGYLSDMRHRLEEIEKARRSLAEEEQALRRQRHQLDVSYKEKESALKRRLDRQLEKQGKVFKQEVERFIRRLEDQQRVAIARAEASRREAALKQAFRDRSRITELQDETADSMAPLQTGDRVRHRGFRHLGRVIEVDAEEVIIDLDGKRVACSRSDVELLESGRRTWKSPTSNVRLEVVEETRRELNLIGKTVEEALAQADKFLDSAFVSDLSEVRLIHGIGTGRLRAALVDWLRDHPHVENFTTEGGSTAVRLAQ